jgi:hypothetical protein
MEEIEGNKKPKKGTPLAEPLGLERDVTMTSAWSSDSDTT